MVSAWCTRMGAGYYLPDDVMQEICHMLLHEHVNKLLVLCNTVGQSCTAQIQEYNSGNLWQCWHTPASLVAYRGNIQLSNSPWVQLKHPWIRSTPFFTSLFTAYISFLRRYTYKISYVGVSERVYWVRYLRVVWHWNRNIHKTSSSMQLHQVHEARIEAKGLSGSKDGSQPPPRDTSCQFKR